MPEHIRALIFILVLSSVAFFVMSKIASDMQLQSNFLRRKNVWLALTATAFLVQNFWLYVLVAFVVLVYQSRKEDNPVAMYFYTLFLLPVASAQIPGMGLINYVFDLTNPRLLVLVLLFPVLIAGRRDASWSRLGSVKPDIFLVVYLLLLMTLALLRDSTITNALRNIFYLFIDIFVPYYIISRSLSDITLFKDALLSLVASIMVVGILAIFENVKHWLLYAQVMSVLGIEGMTGYLGRGDMLRANVTAGQAIALGFMMVSGIGIYLFISRYIRKSTHLVSGALLLAGGMIAPLSRGPWLGAAFMIFLYIMTGKHAVRRAVLIALSGMLVLSIVSQMPGGQKVIDLLPFIGNTEKENVDYREQLITNSMIVIKRNLLLGSKNYYQTPEMEAMRQGQGIIDIVNSYIQVTLDSGLIGLILFCGFFFMVLLGIVRALRSIHDKNSEKYQLGRVLLASTAAMLMIIFTTSSITVIPIIYWAFAGMGVAYAEMIRKDNRIAG